MSIYVFLGFNQVMWSRGAR